MGSVLPTLLSDTGEYRILVCFSFWIDASFSSPRVVTGFLFPVLMKPFNVINWRFQGHAFNTFPKMGDHWVPEGLMDMKPFFRNFFENTATVQVILPAMMQVLSVQLLDR